MTRILPAVVKIVLSVIRPAAPRYAEVPTPSRTDDNATKEFLQLVSSGRSRGQRRLHVIEGEAVCAWRDRSLSCSLYSTCQQFYVGLLILNDELQVFKEVFAETGLPEIVFGEQRQSRLVKDVLQMFKLSQAVSFVATQGVSQSYRQCKLKYRDVNVLRPLEDIEAVWVSRS